MKRYGHLWEKITTFENLLLAWHKAIKGKRSRPAVIEFGFQLEKNLFQLQSELLSGNYQPGKYHLFTIYERKPRHIAAAPFIDRIVHHALLNIIEPLIDTRFIDHSYACRQNKGVHKAVKQYQTWSQKYAYALKMDVLQYFPSIDHLLLKEKLSRLIKDKSTLSLLWQIIDGSPIEVSSNIPLPDDDLLTLLERPRGIPIGNLTSQFFANVFLNDLDHFIQTELKCSAYLRYVDDFIILSNDKRKLQQIKQQLSEFLKSQRLYLHPKKAHVMPVNFGVDVLGYRVFPHFSRLRNDNGHRFARKLRQYAKGYALGRLDWEDFNPSVQSWIGHVCHADTIGLRQTLFSEIVFQRDTGHEISGVARRLLEQQTAEVALGEP